MVASKNLKGGRSIAKRVAKTASRCERGHDQELVMEGEPAVREGVARLLWDVQATTCLEATAAFSAFSARSFFAFSRATRRRSLPDSALGTLSTNSIPPERAL